MAKFIIPDYISKVPKSTPRPNEVYPLGQLYIHTPSGIMFAFLQLGSRWDTTYAMSTSKGTFCRLGFGRSDKMGGFVDGDKNFVVAKFLKFLETGKI